ncbi:MAG TPA: hypothetical protein VF157_07890, partial [Chloroflexota bacterium]
MASAQTPDARPNISPYAPMQAPASSPALFPIAYTQQKPLPGAPLPPAGGIRTPEAGLERDQVAPYTIQLEPPGLERLAQSVQSDASLQERIRQENRERPTPERVSFPADPILSRDIYNGRKWDPMKLEVAPYYVCYGRLRFEEKNAERYGWDLGPLHPLLSAALFYADVALLPYHMATEPCRKCECSAGYCLPG